MEEIFTQYPPIDLRYRSYFCKALGYIPDIRKNENFRLYIFLIVPITIYLLLVSIYCVLIILSIPIIQIIMLVQRILYLIPTWISLLYYQNTYIICVYLIRDISLILLSFIMVPGIIISVYYDPTSDEGIIGLLFSCIVGPFIYYWCSWILYNFPAPYQRFNYEVISDKKINSHV